MDKGLGRVVFLHGLKTRRNDRRLHRIASHFFREGFTPVIPYYGYIPMLFAGIVGWVDRRLADSLSSFIEEDDILVGHSNGGTLVFLISQRVRIRGAVLINPALESDLAPKAAFVHVYFNAGDLVTRLSALIPFNIWGDMGATGYRGSEEYVTSIDQANPPPMLPALDGHSDIFEPRKLRPWSRYMARLAATEVRRLRRLRK